MTNINKLDFSVNKLDFSDIIASDGGDRQFLVNRYNGHLYSINRDVYANTQIQQNVFIVKVFIKSALYHTCNIKIIIYNEFYLNTKWSVYNDTHIIFLIDDTIHFIPFSLMYKEQCIDANSLIKVKIPEFSIQAFYKLCNNYLLGKRGTYFSEIFKISINGLIRIHEIEPIYFEVEYFDSNYIILCKDSRIHIFQLSTKTYIVDSSTSFPEHINCEEIYVNPINGRLIGTAKWNYHVPNVSKLLFISQLQLTDIRPDNLIPFKSIIRISRILNTNNIYKQEIIKQLIHVIAGDIPKPILDKIIKIGYDRKTLRKNLLEHYNKMFE